MKSSTQAVLEHTAIPKHIAVIMDGNGRWAKKRFLPRIMGHKRGLDALENMVKHCAKLGVQYLTVFAFSTENWQPPRRRSFVPDGAVFTGFAKTGTPPARKQYAPENTGQPRTLQPSNPEGHRRGGGVDGKQYRSDPEHCRRLRRQMGHFAGGKQTDCQRRIRDYGRHAGETLDAGRCARAGFVHPHRRRNAHQQFPTWQMAYAELYFTDILWPDFDGKALDDAVASFQKRERRFGRTSEQLPIEQQRN